MPASELSAAREILARSYVKLGQIGFLMWSRHGGNFTDVGGAVKYYANSAT